MWPARKTGMNARWREARHHAGHKSVFPPWLLHRRVLNIVFHHVVNLHVLPGLCRELVQERPEHPILLFQLE
jgi:hypothetical protein